MSSTTVSTCVETSELLSFLLVGLRKHVHCIIGLWKHINKLLPLLRINKLEFHQMKPYRREKFLYSSFAWRILISQQFSMHLYLLLALSRLILLFVINWIDWHLYLAFLFHRDYFDPIRCISILLFCATRIISAGRMHSYLPLFHRRDYFSRPDASLSSSFSPQGLFRLGQIRPSSLKPSLSDPSVDLRFKQFSTYLIHCLKS